MMEDAPPRVLPETMMGERPDRCSEGLVKWNVAVVLAEWMLSRKKAGVWMLATPRLSWPASMTRMESFGSASAKRPATTQAAVPPAR